MKEIKNATENLCKQWKELKGKLYGWKSEGSVCTETGWLSLDV